MSAAAAHAGGRSEARASHRHSRERRASAVIVRHRGTVNLLVLVPKEVGEVGGGLGEAARGEGDGRRSGR
jgi:hypothetical protein